MTAPLPPGTPLAEKKLPRMQWAVAPCAFSVRRIRIYRLTEIDFDQIERRYRESLCLFVNFTKRTPSFAASFTI
ncbi:hypothetical protein [Sinorhizobium sp. Sb3]|uniref:hypothetical protein n=1 Tax=Sinorhizobium sp. Sb3 TaxID=1358417 RepID=UPI0012E3C21A|nr:hypothetical protein [Sinorhizobium sp. Sb3]